MLNQPRIDHHKVITESMLIIERGLLHEIDIDSLIENNPLPNEDYLRHFEKITGETPQEFQTRLRTEYALKILLLKKANIDNVHTLSGFKHRDDFTDSFLKHFHHDPEDMMAQQEIRHDLISFDTRPKIGVANQGVIIDQIDETITIEECAPVAVQALRNIGAYKEAYKAWLGLLYRAGTRKALGSQHQQIGITYDFPSITPAKHLRYDACISMEEPVDSLTQKTIDGGQYAVYSHQEGPSSLDDMITKILTLWLPRSDYLLSLKPIYFTYENFGRTTFTMNQIVINVHIPVEPR